MTVALYLGDCLETLKTLETCLVQTCVTSPPYYGLRDYGVDGQIGLKKTPSCGLHGKIKLRRDLSKKQIDYVVQRLLDAGLLYVLGDDNEHKE